MRRASTTLLLVTEAEGALGNGGEGISLDMMAIFGFGFFSVVKRRSFAVRNKEESKIIMVPKSL